MQPFDLFWIILVVASYVSQFNVYSRYFSELHTTSDLFPSTQTWYLGFVVLSLNTIDWVLFLLLDIGNTPISVRQVLFCVIMTTYSSVC